MTRPSAEQSGAQSRVPSKSSTMLRRGRRRITHLLRTRAHSRPDCTRRNYLHSLRQGNPLLRRLLPGVWLWRPPPKRRPGGAGSGSAAVSCRCGPSQVAWRHADRARNEQCKVCCLLCRLQEPRWMMIRPGGVRVTALAVQMKATQSRWGPGHAPPPTLLLRSFLSDVSSMKTSHTLANVVEDGGNFYHNRPTPPPPVKSFFFSLPRTRCLPC